MAQRVLVAFDESTQAHAALRRAFALFPEGDVVALHVNDPGEWSFGDETYGYHSTEDFERATESAEELLDEARAIARDHGRTVQAVTETGKVADAIVAYAERHDVDHVVIGSHGRAGLARFLLGSVAETVARRSPVSVTIVREESE